MNVCNNEYKSIQEIVSEFCEYTLDKKIESLKKLSTTITYNSDYQNYLCKIDFLKQILSEIKNLNQNEENVKVYTMLFYLLFHNLIIGNGVNQVSIFKTLFCNENTFLILDEVTKVNILDNKIKKFLLSIFYNLVLNNEINLKMLKSDHLDFFLRIYMSINFNEKNINNKDLNDINDFIHINFKYILKNEIFILNSNHTLCSHLVNIQNETQKLTFLEIIRDFVDYSKDSKTLSISSFNLKSICKKFEENVKQLFLFFKEFSESKFLNYENYLMTNEDSIIYSFREFICFVDILSVFSVSEEFPEYKEIVRKEINLMEVVDCFYFMLNSTDKFYEEMFKRNKLLNNEEAVDVPILNENNFLFGFQTNIMKVLSNLAFKNSEIKEKFLEDPIKFYYFLNHLKLDKCNPFKKEWTVLYIKAVTEGNTKIQNLIKELRPNQMDPLLKDYILNKGNVQVGNKSDLHKSPNENSDEDD